VRPDRGAALVLATPMIVSTSIEMNLSFASTSLCSGANKVSSDSSGGGIGHPGYWFSLSKHPEDLLEIPGNEFCEKNPAGAVGV